MGKVTFSGTIEHFGQHCFRKCAVTPRRSAKGNEMQDTAAKKTRQAYMMILFSFLSALSAAATAVVPILIHS